MKKVALMPYLRNRARMRGTATAPNSPRETKLGVVRPRAMSPYMVSKSKVTQTRWRGIAESFREPWTHADGASALGAHSGAFEAWQDLSAEIRQLIRVIDERNRDAADTGPRQRDEAVGDPLRDHDKRQPAHAMHLETPL